MPAETRLHHQVLTALADLSIPGHDVRIEQRGGRIDLPAALPGENPTGRRGKALCYTDALVHRDGVPRILVEVVDSSPADPNGIAGLVVNVDRIAATHPGIDLLFVVLAQPKTFYCRTCGRGHRLADPENQACLARQLQANTEEDLAELVHDGLAANYIKALVRYPIAPYLHHMPPPVVLFLDAGRAAETWTAYREQALDLVRGAVHEILAGGPCATVRLLGLRELLAG